MKKVSVIIPTKNSEKFIRRCLINLQGCRQYYPDMEVIVVDNYSDDQTTLIAREFVDKVCFKGPERTAQANYGIKQATGEIIYLTGSDMIRDWEFIREGVKKIEEGYDAIYMSVETHTSVKHFWGVVKALERESYIGTFIESARFFKKSVWEDLGGFDEEMIGLEEDFQHRLDYGGYKTGRIDCREYHLHEESNLLQVFKKFYYYGKFMRRYLRVHKNRGYKQLNPIRPNLKVFLRHPVLLIGLIIYKCTQYLAGGLGMIFG